MMRENLWKRTLAGVTAISMMAALAACGSDEGGSTSADGDGIAVVASINQWGSVASELGGDLVDVTTIMSNTGVEAHDYEPTSQDVGRFASAQVAVVNGADYDAWAVKAAESTQATLVDAAEAAGKTSGDNPHVWFSADARSATADAITAAYIEADPENQATFERLNEAWHEREADLESAIETAAATTDGLNYAATESVAAYLADDLQLNDATPTGYAQATANDSEPTPSDLKEFIDAFSGGDIAMLVVNTQESNATTDQIVQSAEQADVPIVEITEQMPAEYDDLIAWMEALVEEFAQAVK
ncbi:metal ABC transporter solute-binding protein, Zn/Mn family [Bifidobacterium eulemuris]|uniref:ABC transporter substrate-binding protein n=1 Tax=Bifidobacterium eulemuris TaxID=1765219 RepID=A0A261GB28_9BIFI|nr:zinc ABC transporter substrate-binding protein [Bifidobacterium eulemuris]OZG68176.1 ABC transporter substrate-binding protein [Bifidobacterium eulemuris]QOL31765.1 zinc ABC transporter substrate-binding protein [Bifidobacterium eulemuris]